MNESPFSFAYCQNCDWQQDYFWTVRYNPVTRFYDLLRRFSMPKKVCYGRTELPFKCRMFSWSVFWILCRQIITELWSMKWRTLKAWERDSAHICPNCGKDSVTLYNL